MAGPSDTREIGTIRRDLEFYDTRRPLSRPSCGLMQRQIGQNTPLFRCIEVSKGKKEIRRKWNVPNEYRRLEEVRAAERFIALFAIATFVAATFLPCESTSSANPGVLWASTADAMPSAHESESSPVASPQAHHASHVAVQAPATAARLEFKPTCLCGCSDTRSQIGGGAARLGSVLPGTALARLLEAEPVILVEQGSPTESRFHLEIDPIPI